MAAKSAFRGLLRAAKDLCGEDMANLRRARAEIRAHFDKSRNVTDAAEIQRLLNDAREAEDFIQRNLVQAKMTRPGTYSVKLKDPDAPQGKVGVAEKQHVDFEPMAPQVAIEKTLNPQPKKAPEIKTSSSNTKCCSSQGHGHSH